MREKVTILSPPKGIVFHDLESATQVYSNIPMPAYTSRDLIHITPLIDVWKNIFLSVTEGKVLEKAQRYYKQLNSLHAFFIQKLSLSPILAKELGVLS